MNILISPEKLHGTVRIPASKSMAHRLLICAALAEGTSVVSGVDMSRDITATMDVLSAFRRIVPAGRQHHHSHRRREDQTPGGCGGLL